MSEDRPWQHPAERGAEHGHGYVVNPPPLGRRISMLTTIVCIVVSVALIAVAIPKGISEYTDQPDVATPTTVPRVKGALGWTTTVVSGATSSSALALGDGYWLVAGDRINSGEPLWLRQGQSAPVPAILVSNVGETGVALIEVDRVKPAMNVFDFSKIRSPHQLGELTSYWVFDPGTEKTSRLEPSISSMKGIDDVPVNPRDAIDGIATVVDKGGTTVGIAVRRGHSTWLLGRSSIAELTALMTRR